MATLPSCAPRSTAVPPPWGVRQVGKCPTVTRACGVMLPINQSSHGFQQIRCEAALHKARVARTRRVCWQSPFSAHEVLVFACPEDDRCAFVTPTPSSG